MFDEDPRRDAVILADLLREGTVRAVFRALIRNRDEEALAHLRTALGSGVERLDLGEPVFREWLIEVLEYRISPPDDEDLGPTSPFDSGSFTLPMEIEPRA